MIRTYSLVAFAINLLFYGSAHDIVSPILQLANIARFFDSIEACDRKVEILSEYDDYGSVNVRYKVKIKEDENKGKYQCTVQYKNVSHLSISHLR